MRIAASAKGAPEEQGVTPPHPTVTVLADRCAGCQECIVRCPTGALTLNTERWVVTADATTCVGCRQCTRTCPFSAIRVEGPLVVDGRETLPAGPVDLGNVDEVHGGFVTWDEAIAAAERCLECPDPTCVRGCPAHNDIPSFVAAIRDRDLGRAHEVLRRTTVLPDICSRVCDQSTQCEGACSWSLAGGDAVAIGLLERFVTDRVPVPPPSPRPGRSPSVAVVGSGPAGIAAAWELVDEGADVTVYERDDAPAGLLGWGIPDFTLPASVAERPWRQLVAAGVSLRLGVEVTPDDVGSLLGTHDAVLVATGAGEPMRLGVPGSELDGVTDATTFLRFAKSALRTPRGTRATAARFGIVDPEQARVLVLGAGNTAMDVARTARRLGLAATCIDWLDERFALSRPDELAQARTEGVDIRFGRTLTRLEGRGRAEVAVLATTTQEHASEAPHVTDVTESLAVGLVVMAMGYRIDPAVAQTFGTPIHPPTAAIPDRTWIASGVLAANAARSRRGPVGTRAVEREAHLAAATSSRAARVWVAGDALVGPSTVVEAMAQGRRAAHALLASLAP